MSRHTRSKASEPLQVLSVFRRTSSRAASASLPNMSDTEEADAQTPAQMASDFNVMKNSFQAMLQQMQQATTQLQQSASAAGTVHSLSDRLSDLRQLRSVGPVPFSPEQLEVINNKSIQKNMEGLPIVVASETSVYRGLQSDGFSVKENGGGGSLRHELPVLLTNVAVDGLIADVAASLQDPSVPWSKDSLLAVVGPNSPLLTLLQWSAGLHAARLKSIQRYVRDGPLAADAYVCGRFAEIDSQGEDLMDAQLRKVMLEGKCKAIQKNLQQQMVSASVAKTVVAVVADGGQKKQRKKKNKKPSAHNAGGDDS
jgi:hypothetical protein